MFMGLGSMHSLLLVNTQQIVVTFWLMLCFIWCSPGLYFGTTLIYLLCPWYFICCPIQTYGLSLQMILLCLLQLAKCNDDCASLQADL